MDVIVIESEAFQELKRMFTSLADMNQKLVKENIGLKSRMLLSAQEVANMTGYNQATIRKKKYEIGFVSIDNMVCFELATVEAWIAKNRVMAK